MEISVPWTPVKALLHVAAKDDIREWCNGVWIDRQGPYLTVWGTTGTVLGAYHTNQPSTDGPDLFLPRHIVEACKSFAVEAQVKREHDGRMSISCMGTTHYWQEKDFRPADWRRAIPSSTTGIAQCFDVTLLAAFVKVRKALGFKDHASAVSLAHNGGPTYQRKTAEGLLAVLRDVPEFIGVLAPIHTDDQGTPYHATAPDWVTERGRLPVEEPEGADLV